ncbi:MAG: hypothetical protein HYU53_05385 [Acidobacteria bacterium]|nr:hypothetical protein [Acidobacteriota bacterium]
MAEQRKQESLDNDVIAGDEDLVGREVGGGEPAWEGPAKPERREVPGGDHPARTPGGTGPSTRDTEHAVADDANEQLIGRSRVGGALKARARPADK